MTVIAAAMGTACIVTAQNKPASPVNDSEAYSVYASLLPKVWGDIGRPTKELVVQRDTVTYSRCLPSNGSLDTEWSRVVASYNSENSNNRTLVQGQSPVWTFELGSTDTIRSSNAYIQVSAVGFDELKTRALVYVQYRSGAKGGGGRYYFLQKVEGSWREARVPGGNTCGWDA